MREPRMARARADGDRRRCCARRPRPLVSRVGDDCGARDRGRPGALLLGPLAPVAARARGSCPGPAASRRNGSGLEIEPAESFVERLRRQESRRRSRHRRSGSRPAAEEERKKAAAELKNLTQRRRKLGVELLLGAGQGGTVVERSMVGDSRAEGRAVARTAPNRDRKRGKADRARGAERVGQGHPAPDVPPTALPTRA